MLLEAKCLYIVISVETIMKSVYVFAIAVLTYMCASTYATTCYTQHADTTTMSSGSDVTVQWNNAITTNSAKMHGVFCSGSTTKYCNITVTSSELLAPFYTEYADTSNVPVGCNNLYLNLMLNNAVYWQVSLNKNARTTFNSIRGSASVFSNPSTLMVVFSSGNDANCVGSSVTFPWGMGRDVGMLWEMLVVSS